MWERFEQRKPKEGHYFMVSLVADATRREGYLAFNKLVQQQVLRGHPWCDLFFDRLGRRIGVRFLPEAADMNSYHVGIYPAPGRTQARISLRGFLKHHGLLDGMAKRTFHAELKHDPLESLWWFSVAPLLESNHRVIGSLRSGRSGVGPSEGETAA